MCCGACVHVQVAELDALRAERKVKRWRQPQGKEAALPAAAPPLNDPAGLASGDKESRLAMHVETEPGQQ